MDFSFISPCSFLYCYFPVWMSILITIFGQGWLWGKVFLKQKLYSTTIFILLEKPMNSLTTNGVQVWFFIWYKITQAMLVYSFSRVWLYFWPFLIIKTIKLKDENIRPHFLIFFFAVQAIAYNIFSTIRCRTFSFLFFVFYIYILEYSKTKNNRKILWTLPVLNILWANIHGGFCRRDIFDFIVCNRRKIKQKSF